MRNELGDIRRSQVITSHGPGSIIDFRAGGYGGASISVVAAGLEEWDRWSPPPGLGNPQTVFEPRLQKQLGVDGFRLPPVAPQVAPGVYSTRSGKLVGARFPRWLQCPACHILRVPRRWSEDPGDPALFCAPCSEKAGGRNRVHVVPVRFIVLCENGHLDEFPWEWWIRHKEGCSRRGDLKLEGSSVAGLGGLILTCLECEQRRSMEGCFAADAIPKPCRGRRPWLGDGADEPCSAQPRAAQRGASNLYFSVTESALDIPPWSDELQKKIGIRWALLERAPDQSARRVLIEALRLSEVTGYDLGVLSNLIEDRIARLASPNRNLRWEEYKQFVQHQSAFGENSEFEIRPAPAPPEVADWITTIVRATRLREVRVQRGFTRVYPPAMADDARIARISVHPLSWLPAVENRGEGIFVQLRSDRIREWEALPAVLERAAEIQATYESAWRERGHEEPPQKQVSARFLLIHSLAHALMNQFSLNCGYSSAALRERLYVGLDDWDMCGLLIYTSSPDADGTLGGLARQGEAQNFISVFEDCLRGMTWCSSDPLCIEGIHSLSAATNGAACHSCLLVSETSCEEFNSFLDRALLVGTPSEPQLGFFSSYLSLMRE